MIENSEVTPPTNQQMPSDVPAPLTPISPSTHTPKKILITLSLIFLLLVTISFAVVFFRTTQPFNQCGGVLNLSCPFPLTCKLEGNYPDAGGTCQLGRKNSPSTLPTTPSASPTPLVTSEPSTPIINPITLPQLPAQIPWETEANFTYDQALIDNTNFNYYPLTGILHTYTYDSSNTTDYQTILQSFLSQLENQGWQQKTSYNQVSYSPLQADGPTGSTDGRLIIDNQGNVRVVLWSQYGTSCTAPGDCASIELELFISDTTPVITLPTD